MPRIRAALAGGVRTLGGEDCEELIQDAIAHAAAMLHRAEEQGKQVTPGNFAFYALRAINSGRRSTGGEPDRRHGTWHSARSQEKRPVVRGSGRFDAETNEAVPLGEVLAGNLEEPAMAGGRNLD